MPNQIPVIVRLLFLLMPVALNASKPTNNRYFYFDFFIIRSTRPLAKAFELTGFAAPVFQNRKINK